MTRGLYLGVEAFYGADNVPYTWTDDPTKLALWNLCETTRKQFGASITKQTWDYGDTYQDHFRPYRMLEPYGTFIGGEKILVFDGLEANNLDSTTRARVKESFKRLYKLGAWRGTHAQAGPELPENVAGALAKMRMAELVKEEVAPYARLIYNPPILCMPTNNYVDIINAVYATKRTGIPTVDFYVDMRISSNLTTALNTMMDTVRSTFLALGIAERSIAVMEYGMNEAYANENDQAALCKTMRTLIEARQYKSAMLYACFGGTFALCDANTAGLTDYGTSLIANL